MEKLQLLLSKPRDAAVKCSMALGPFFDSCSRNRPIFKPVYVYMYFVSLYFLCGKLREFFLKKRHVKLPCMCLRVYAAKQIFGQNKRTVSIKVKSQIL